MRNLLDAVFTYVMLQPNRAAAYALLAFTAATLLIAAVILAVDRRRNQTGAQPPPALPRLRAPSLDELGAAERRQAGHTTAELPVLRADKRLADWEGP